MATPGTARTSSASTTTEEKGRKCFAITFLQGISFLFIVYVMALCSFATRTSEAVGQSKLSSIIGVFGTGCAEYLCMLPYSRNHSRLALDLFYAESLLIPLVCLVCGNTQIDHLQNKRRCHCFINYLPFRCCKQCQRQVYEALGEVMWCNRSIELNACG